MSKIVWNTLKLGSSVLVVSLLVAHSTMASETPASEKGSAETVAPETVAPTVQPADSLQPFQEYSQTPEAIVEKTASQHSGTTPSLDMADTTPVLQELRSNGAEEPESFRFKVADSTPVAQMPVPGTFSPQKTTELEQDQYTNEVGTTDSMDQVTNVSQLQDVEPTDWAYEALRSLVERYGCIAGYPDGTFRGNRALSRYEFAAGMNACLLQIEKLIAASSADFVTKEDLATLQRLIDEFGAELATLRTRVDNLEGRTAFLESHQFSTTTKLAGEAIFGIADAFGGIGDDVNTVFHDRVRLNLLTSFTGKDRLRTRLQVGNAVPLLGLGGSAANPNSFNGSIAAAQRTNEGRFTYDGSNNSANDNDVFLDVLDYRFPLGDKLTVTLTAANGLHHYYADTVNPYFEGYGGGNNSLSRFGERNPIYRIGPLGAGVGLNYKISNALKLDLGYLSNTGNNPGDDNGIFSGNYSGLAQLVFGTNRFKVGFTYIHAYDDGGNNAPRFAMGGTGTGLANLNPATLAAATTGGLTQAQLSRPVSSNSYGLEASFQLTPQFVLNGWVGKTDARLIGLGDADIWNFALGLALPDFGKKGNLLGILAGAEPTLRGLNVPGPENFERDFAYHFEGFYKYQMTNNISITPGIIWLASPNQNADNDDIIIGTIRTTFTF